jgi:hypothetical protein
MSGIPNDSVMTKWLIALLCLRVVALYHGVRWVKWLLWIGFVLSYGVRSGLNLAVSYYYSGEYMIFMRNVIVG